MFIFNQPDVTSLLETGVEGKAVTATKNSHLVDRRRFINIFADPDAGFNGADTRCRAIQINISTSKAEGVMFDNVVIDRLSDTTLSYVTVYIYNVELAPGMDLKERFRFSKCELVASKRLDRQVNHTTKEVGSESANLFSKVYANHGKSEWRDVRGCIPDPRYYTSEYEFHYTGDYNPNGILGGIDQFFVGNELLDDETQLIIRKPSDFNTIKDMLFINDEVENYRLDDVNGAASRMIANVNDIIGMDNLVNGGVLVYDTQLGKNFVGGSIISKPYLTDSAAKSEFDELMMAIDSSAKEVEKKFGSIRLMYSPSLLGSKNRIIFKDYNNLSSDGINASKDSGYEVNETVGTLIDEGSFINEGLVEDLHYDQPLFKEKIIAYG